jgi:hypothetical protein
VVLLLGRVYRLQGKTTLANQVLAVARDLDPRNAPKIAKLVEETTTSRSRVTGTGGRSIVGSGNGEASIEGASEGVIDVSMEGSMDG